jgi:hypothetical protein
MTKPAWLALFYLIAVADTNLFTAYTLNIHVTKYLAFALMLKWQLIIACLLSFYGLQNHA